MKKISFTISLTLFLVSCFGSTHPELPTDWTSIPSPPSFNSSETQNPSTTNPPNPLRIIVLNVGQGDATLLVAPNGKTLLIDAGRDGKGREVILPYLKDHNIHSLDAIVATHYDGDHIGGIDEVIAGEDGALGTEDDFSPSLGVFDRGSSPFDSAPFYSAYLQAAGEIRQTINAGDLLPLDSAITIRCVAVNGAIWNGTLIDLAQPGFNEQENSASIALVVEYGDFRHLTSGDLTGGGSPGGYKTLDVEGPLAEVIGPVTAVHVNHHGSLSSSNETFVNLLHPQAVLFNVGNENDYGHPAQEVLERWRNASAELWLTEKGAGGFVAGENIVNGAIEVETDGFSITINGK